MEANINYFVNNFIPADTYFLKRLLKENGENSQITGWNKIHTSILIPRLKGLVTIPASCVYAGYYAINGIMQAGIEVLDGRFQNAFTRLKGELSFTLKCLAATVAFVAYAVFGIFAGSKIYSKFIPATPKTVPAKPEVNIEELKAKHEKEIADLKLEAKNEIQKKEDELTKTIDDLNKNVGDKKTKNKELKTQLEDTKLQIQKLAQELVILSRKDDSQLKAQVDHLAEKNEKLTKEIEKLNSEKQELRDEHARLNASYCQLRSVIRGAAF